ncbi:DNA-binding protein inhibitor ID-4 [Dissostichus eleginoides]|nr:DNA-binding protein inhibitor ID-4 [Dissostichus eleginoides]
MKAVTPVPPQDSSSSSSQLSLQCLSKQSLSIARCRIEEEDLFCLQYDMNDCYSRLKRLVPTIPQDKKVSKVEILQHVIDYILDLQLALETHPTLHKQQPQRTGSCPPPASTPSRTPLTVLNVDHQQRTAIWLQQPEELGLLSDPVCFGLLIQHGLCLVGGASQSGALQLTPPPLFIPSTGV